RRPEGEVPAQFHELIDRLTARYPCFCDLPDEEIDDGAWSDGPLRNNAEYAMTVLGLASDHVEEVQPFVVETANSLGLIVFDEQQGRIYRPGVASGSAETKKGSRRRRSWWKFWS